MAEAEYVASYMTNGGDKADFMARFKNAMSEGFDPDTVRNHQFVSQVGTGGEEGGVGGLDDPKMKAQMVDHVSMAHVMLYLFYHTV